MLNTGIYSAIDERNELSFSGVDVVVGPNIFLDALTAKGRSSQLRMPESDNVHSQED